jgi:ribosomal protein S18 acetylase RimI-like enzyme
LSAYSLRGAVDADYDFLYALHVATMRDSITATWGWDDSVQEALFRERWDPSGPRVVVVGAEDAGILDVDRQATKTFISLIELHPRYQGRGIGTAIIRDVLQEAHGRGVPAALSVLKANPAARRLYQRLGFVVTEEPPDRYIMVCVPPT